MVENIINIHNLEEEEEEENPIIIWDFYSIQGLFANNVELILEFPSSLYHFQNTSTSNTSHCHQKKRSVMSLS